MIEPNRAYTIDEQDIEILNIAQDKHFTRIQRERCVLKQVRKELAPLVGKVCNKTLNDMPFLKQYHRTYYKHETYSEVKYDRAELVIWPEERANSIYITVGRRPDNDKARPFRITLKDIDEKIAGLEASIEKNKNAEGPAEIAARYNNIVHEYNKAVDALRALPAWYERRNY